MTAPRTIVATSVPTTPGNVDRFLEADGRIGLDPFFYGGRWDVGLLAEMAAANDAD